ncbi:hypothetical protein M9458_037397, partial [Cirrhinus mrigala]
PPWVCQSPSVSWLKDPLSLPAAPESRTLPRLVDPAAPPRLLAPSSLPWPGSPLALRGSLVPRLSSTILRLVTPLLPLRLVPQPLWLCEAPPSLWLHLDSLSLRLHPALSDPHLRVSRRRHLLHLGPSDPPRHPGCPSPPRAAPSVGHMESSSLLGPGSHLAPPTPSPSCHLPGSSIRLIRPGSSCFYGTSTHLLGGGRYVRVMDLFCCVFHPYVLP